jgi:hypothetical protein
MSPIQATAQPEVERAPARQPDRVAFSIGEFCARNGIGSGTYHKLKRLGLGPDEMRFGNVVRITAEAELKWQRARTYPKGDEAKAKARSEAVTAARGRKAGKLSAASPRHWSKMSPEERAARAGRR